MAKTRTGGFPIGFRMGGKRSQDCTERLIKFAAKNEMECLDIGMEDLGIAQKILDLGLGIGSIDIMPYVKSLISDDASKRADAIAESKEFIEKCGRLGGLNLFTVMSPENPAKEPAENFDYMVEGFSPLFPVMEKHGCKLVIEGWPGPGALCCTPEGYRDFQNACPSPANGINYDPSHLIRMGIDPIRFLNEFIDRVYHVHGKDTEILPEELYEYGNLLPPIHGCTPGLWKKAWRYTIPGHGVMRWSDALQILQSNGYTGYISIEMEDKNFGGPIENAEQGLIFARQNLESF